ncbi:uncharacterized protein [Palaemon carinicauda]|uniref:uncharacterized protein n=1 Tax=Palaemon carinicauda TaxID=392227 RepID=UPI0035B589F1
MYHDDNAPLKLTNDANNVACSAVLEQIVNGYLQHLAFFSKKIKSVETRPPASDPRIPEVFRRMSSRQQRHLVAIMEFGCNISYILGKKNPVADALSRIKIITVNLGISFANFAVEQQNDPEARLLSEKFIWPGIKKDSCEWSRTCINCQTSKVSRHNESRVFDLPQPKRQFGHIHLDVVRPLLLSVSARYLLTIVDHSTRWLEANPKSEATIHACAEALLLSWISRFCDPDDLMTDRGSALLLDIWLSLANLLGTTLHSTTA